MKCLFCNKTLLATAVEIAFLPSINCDKCSVAYALEYDEANNDYTIRYYGMSATIKEGMFLMEFYIDDNAMGLYEISPDIHTKLIFALDYLPKVTPKTKKAWLNKIMSMKAFL